MQTVIKFETRYAIGKEPQDWVLLAPRGEAMEKTQTWHRVSTLIPNQDAPETDKQSLHYRAQAARWAAIKPAYDAWKAGSETPIDGLPLAAWPALNAQQTDFLKRMGILTVENVRDMDDKTKAACRWPDAHRLPELAKKFLEGQDVAAKDAELEEMRERMRIMEEMLEGRAEAKRGPGRPKKSESEAA